MYRAMVLVNVVAAVMDAVKETVAEIVVAATTRVADAAISVPPQICVPVVVKDNKYIFEIKYFSIKVHYHSSYML